MSNLTVKEMLQKLRDPNNWTNDFFAEIESLYFEHLNTVRNTLTAEGLWDRFDRAFGEWKKPGQAGVVMANKKVVCDNGAARTLSENNLSMETIDQVEEQDPQWLITDYMPRGQVTTLAGDGGVEKTSVWCAIAAAVSSGKQCFMLDGAVPVEFSECNPEGLYIDNYPRTASPGDTGVK